MTRLAVYRIPFSTNVERVALAAGHKGLAIDWIDVEAADRSAVVAVSGQPLVPVLVIGDEVIADSPRILRRLEQLAPAPPLWPADPARAAEMDVFLDWFNELWKAPPNRIADAHARGEDDDDPHLREWLDRFEALLGGRDFLFGDELTAADVTAYPFLRYGRHELPADDTDVFHRVLAELMSFDERSHPRLAAWVRRIDLLPRG